MNEPLNTILSVIFLLGVFSMYGIEVVIIRRLKKIYPEKWESFVWCYKSRLRYFYFGKQIRENKINDEKLNAYFKTIKILTILMFFVWIGLFWSIFN